MAARGARAAVGDAGWSDSFSSISAADRPHHTEAFPGKA